ncbi:MAG TPA: AI-2E family transporter [Actinophytocola sp.]|uniref:AI-2E family transporter n=1 Tax=Actinophytocola sp. TaxID=1872138 RepID=UPI002DBE7D1A|nr:AI-2E family transporter [Actinophytocola sp.]HEU5472644.1 AI-2E family transporter [Actinophytocola sp.]
MNSGPATGEMSPAANGSPLTLVPRGLIILLGISSAVVTAAGAALLSWLIGPVFLALIIVLCVMPVQTWLRGRGVPRWVATSALVIGVYAVLVALVLVMIVSLAQLGSLLPEYADKARGMVEEITAALTRLGVAPDQLATLSGAFDIDTLTALIGSILAAVGGLVSSIIFILSLLLFLSLETRYTGARLAMIAADRPHIARAMGDFVRSTRRYMIVTTVIGVLTGVLDATVLGLLGVPLPVLWGLLAFLTNYIPYVGFLIGLVPPALLALLEGGWPLMLSVVATYVAISFVLVSLIQPRFTGNRVGLSATVTFVAMLFWAWILGPLGAILSIPLTLLVKTLLIDIDPRARWADVLIGSRSATLGPEAEAR